MVLSNANRRVNRVWAFVTTRSELRAEQQESSLEAPSPKPRHHFLFRLWGVICLFLLSIGCLLNMTLLNADFVKNEVNSSPLESVILSQVNSNLTQYGISTSVLKKSDTEQLINQAVDQIYAGEKINLDFSRLVTNANATIGSQLAQYGISNSILANSSAALTNNLNTMVNGQLNTPEVAQLTAGIRVAKMVTNIVVILSGLCLLVMVGVALWQRHFMGSFAWICLWAAGLTAGAVVLARTIGYQASQQQADIGPFIAQLADDIQQRGLINAAIIGVIGGGLFLLRLLKRG